ncbi:MAG: class A beta-lactamase-related serine hydrolase [Actinomycetota bacterium]|nr:class A beta-lactamase-related serine hydrolase [Actinomycetota bacterium]
MVQDDSEIPGGEPSSEPVPEQSEASPAAVAYQAVAPELPGLDPGRVQGVYQSKLDSSWASVRVVAPSGDEGTYVVFLQREGDSWEARRSIRADEPEHPEYERALLDEVPEDLVKSLYPQSLASAADPSGLLMEPVETGTPPSVEVAEVPPAESVTDEVPEAEREQVDEGLEEARQAIEDYGTEHEGTAGVYVQDLKGGWGYGVNPDEAFFGASIMKVPIMVAVYRKMDEDEFSLRDMFETRPEDWAGGAGWLQWEEAGTDHTVEDYLWLMMTQSDNTATNALMRIVGGPEHVNEVARSMGAPGTVLYQKVTSERAAVPALDNRTTPRDMSTILGKIAAGQAANPESCQKMVELMHQNHLLSPLKAGLPDDVEVAYKGGWLYKVYDEAGLVWHKDHPYVVSIFSKHGSEDPEDGKALLKDISEGVYKAQSDLDD